MERRAMRALLLLVVLLGSLLSTAVAANDTTETFTITGDALLENGQPASTSYVRLDDQGSVSTDNGAYVIEGVTPGRHTLRTYFMNDGHVAVYREIMVTGDMTVDFMIGQNVVTASLSDANSNAANATLRTPSTPWSASNGWAEFGPYPHDTMVEIHAQFDNGTQASHAILMDGGKIGEPWRNHIPISEGSTGVYGYVHDQLGGPVPNIDVVSGNHSSRTDATGFYTMQGLEINVSHTFAYTQQGLEVASNNSAVFHGDSGWMNISLERTLTLPGNVSFTTVPAIVPMEPFRVEWTQAPHATRYVLTLGDVPMYDGPSTGFTFTPQTDGEHRFGLQAVNPNGSTSAYQDLLMVVLPEQDENGYWTAGMSWTYDQTYTPAARDGVLRRTYTCLGSETITDAFGEERPAYVVNVEDPRYMPDERSMRWVDQQSLLTIRSYWADDPSSSNQFTDASSGWGFTNSTGASTSLMEDPSSLWFNRTTIIGVPGHPNGYTDTNSSVLVEHNISVTTPAGTFITTKYTITDINDGVVSWELYYNATVRNHVKVVDRLPGTHSEMVERVLVSYDVPTEPVFITESGQITTKETTVQWGAFPGATEYVLLQNGVEVYTGNATNATVTDLNDGNYAFQLRAIMDDGRQLDAEELVLEVAYESLPPTLANSTGTATRGDTVDLAWTHERGVEYMLLHEKPSGASETTSDLVDLTWSVEVNENGRHRFRVKAIEADGTTSDWSDSVVVLVEEGEGASSRSIGENNPWLLAACVLVFVAIGLQLLLRGRPD